MPFSHHHSDAVFLVALRGVTSAEDLQLIPVHLIHRIQLLLPRMRDRKVKEGASSPFSPSAYSPLNLQTSPSRQIFVTLLGLAIMSALLSISTFVRISPGLFFACVLINAIIQAGLGSFMQTSAIAVASLFGPPAVQAMMAGQAAVAVAISLVQVVSATLSVWAHRDSVTTYESDGSAEARSAFVFFTLSALYLLLVAGAHAWMVAQPVYRSVTAALEPARKSDGGADERRALVSSGPSGQSATAQIFRVAKRNALYEIAVSYVFAVTLVSTFSRLFLHLPFADSALSPSSHPSPSPSSPSTPPSTRSSSAPCTSSSSASATSQVATSSPSRASSSGTRAASLRSPSRALCSFHSSSCATSRRPRLCCPPHL